MRFLLELLLKKNKTALGVIALLAILLELVFNFRCFESLFFEPLVLQNAVVGDGFAAQGDKLYTCVGEETTLEFTDIHVPVHNIYYGVANATDPNDVFLINLSFTDEGHKYYYELPNANEVMGSMETTKYYRLHLAGETEKLKLVFSGISPDHVVQIDEIVVNARVPLRLSISRFAAVFCALVALWFLRPGSELYAFTIGKNKKMNRPQMAIVALLVVCHIALFWKLATSDSQLAWYDSQTPSNYQNLAVSLANGRFDLGYEVDERLTAATNPYDTLLRTTEGIEFRWDTSFYEGKYYSYFGITPVLLLYLPYHLVTGLGLADLAAGFVFASLLAVAACLLLYQIIRKKFDCVPFVTYLLLSVFIIYGSGTLYLVNNALMYDVPNLAGVAFAMMAFALWLYAIDGDRLRPVPLLLGSLCMALVAGCRPQLLLIAVFAVPVFWGHVLKKRTLFSVGGWLNTLCFVLPFAVFGAFIMYYNYARFGSAFQFGHIYMLSTSDLSTKSFYFENVGIALFHYFLQPPNLVGRFPFLRATSYATGVMADAYVEPTLLGGVVAVNPLLYALPLTFFFKKELREKKLLSVVCGLLLVALVFAVICVQQGGLTQRYSMDFNFLVCVAGAILLLVATEAAEGKRTESLLRWFIVCGVAISVVYAFLTVLVTFERPYQSMLSYNPALYFKIQSLIQFWQ